MPVSERQRLINRFKKLKTVRNSWETHWQEIADYVLPRRGDFSRMNDSERITYWRDCMARSEALAREFATLITGDDPLRGVTVFE